MPGTGVPTIAVELLGPPVPPAFIDNGCGPKTKLGWIARLVPDNVYGVNLGPAARIHDHCYYLCGLFRRAKGGEVSARSEVRRYLAWLEESTGEAWEAWEVDVTRADSDAYFRRNVFTLMRAKRGTCTSWRVALYYWLGVRFFGGAAAG